MEYVIIHWDTKEVIAESDNKEEIKKKLKAIPEVDREFYDIYHKENI